MILTKTYHESASRLIAVAAINPPARRRPLIFGCCVAPHGDGAVAYLGQLAVLDCSTWCQQYIRRAIEMCERQHT